MCCSNISRHLRCAIFAFAYSNAKNIYTRTHSPVLVFELALLRCCDAMQPLNNAVV